ncbi:NADPH-dependent oxidoreductase [Salinibacterium sp. NK8237]|uniref:NADPH-dependent oxidoreductase n=1 Tax=Salinibacterium sp. NK8237 TaxID=2792038 RepID=UPI0018CF0C85|nr:NADPH-dependent oxidoreductase [Salinibacterium sp. NK8237]MBH0129441.1 NADPH-dependent oxidoreductase [Salinibacterium sp. NK8237]
MTLGSINTAPTSRIEQEQREISPEFITDTIRVLTSHESIRSFEPTPIAAEALEAILVSARSAPTSSNLQAFSIIVVEDAERRARLAHLVGDQRYVAEAPVMLIFCADVSRFHYLAERQGHTFDADNLEMFLMASVDAALALENALVAAESLGLGAVPIGSVRNQPSAIADELGLPQGVFAVAGLTLGHPREGVRRGTKPRLSSEAVVHREQYSGDDIEKHVSDYDDVMIANGLYSGRQVTSASAQIPDSEYGWAEHTARRTSQPEGVTGPSVAMRDHLKDEVEARGFRIR